MTWSQIKWIAIISMTIDHMATILIYHDIALFDGVTLSMVMHFIGRIAFPIFAYGIAQGVYILLIERSIWGDFWYLHLFLKYHTDWLLTMVCSLLEHTMCSLHYLLVQYHAQFCMFVEVNVLRDYQ